jgi:hypothetical protein
MQKFYITAQNLLESSFKLAHQVFEDGFRPQFIIGIWRGGAPVGIAVQEYFEYRGVSTDHISVRTSSYYGINKQAREIDIHGLHYLLENANADDGLLIVDDVFDSGRSVEALIEEIHRQARLNTPKDIRIACSWYKPSMRKVGMTPHYYVNENDDWLVFPHELEGLSREEILQGKTDLKNIHELF